MMEHAKATQIKNHLGGNAVVDPDWVTNLVIAVDEADPFTYEMFVDDVIAVIAENNPSKTAEAIREAVALTFNK